MIAVTNAKKFAVILTLLVMLICAIAGAAWWGLTAPAVIRRSGQTVIEEGSTASSIWRQLAAEGFTRNTLIWRYHAWRLDAAGSIKSGTFMLTEGEKVPDVIQRLVTGDTAPDELTITYPEGFTLRQIAARTAARGIGTEQEFLAAAQPSAFTEQFPYLADIPPGRDLEGYLFPDTYRFTPDDPPDHVVQRLLANFARKMTPELRDQITAGPRTLDEVVTMASIIEREVQTDSDMALVSGILWQRLDDGVGLAADATVRYALDKWDDPLTADDLAIDSPYNTRRYRGLPPGPIANPGLRALTSAIQPEASDYYYYLSTPQGQTIFSKTLDEHNTNKAEYLR